jgi:hypothetical protein
VKSFGNKSQLTFSGLSPACFAAAGLSIMATNERDHAPAGIAIRRSDVPEFQVFL